MLCSPFSFFLLAAHCWFWVKSGEDGEDIGEDISGGEERGDDISVLTWPAQSSTFVCRDYDNNTNNNTNNNTKRKHLLHLIVDVGEFKGELAKTALVCRP